jgi:hypothetical protein
VAGNDLEIPLQHQPFPRVCFSLGCSRPKRRKILCRAESFGPSQGFPNRRVVGPQNSPSDHLTSGLATGHEHGRTSQMTTNVIHPGWRTSIFKSILSFMSLHQPQILQKVLCLSLFPKSALLDSAAHHAHLQRAVCSVQCAACSVQRAAFTPLIIRRALTSNGFKGRAEAARRHSDTYVAVPPSTR